MSEILPDVNATPADPFPLEHAIDADHAELPAVAAPVEPAGPVTTSEYVSIPLEQGVLVIADSAVFDETHWKSPHSQNVQNGWAIDILGPSAKELANRIPAPHKKEELVDGTWRVVVTNDNEARILKDRLADLMATNPEMKAVVTFAPRDCSIMRIRDAARGKGAAGLVLGGQQGRQIVGAIGPRHTNANVEIRSVDGKAREIVIRLP